MITTTINNLSSHDGEVVSLKGWLFGKRSGGGVIFLQLRDGTGICQCVVEAGKPDTFESASRLTQESSFELTGTVRKEDRAPGGYEIAGESINIFQTAEDYPITRKAHGIDFLMSHRHLWFRSTRQTAILKIRHTLIQSLRNFFDSNGFTLIDTPILQPGVGEDTQTLFPVEYFDRQVYLAQTGQLYVETACMALGKVYCFGPTFRAEKSKTRRHLTEFWMLEPEIAFAELDEVIDLAEDMTCCAVTDVLTRHEDDLKQLGRDIDALKKIQKPFLRMTYSEVVDLLKSNGIRVQLEEELERDRKKLQEMVKKLKNMESQLLTVKKGWKEDKLKAQIHDLREDMKEMEADLKTRPEHIEQAQSFEWGKDLGGSDETIISRQFEKPVFVTDYPAKVKAFYMKQSEDDPRVVRNVDMLAPEGYGEVIGGSQREDDLDILIAKIKEKGLATDEYSWYLDLRKYGTVPHGGFGLGIERLLCWICGLKHVRETIPFPRTMGRAEP